MHTCIIMNKSGYRTNIRKLAVDTAQANEKSCYISLKDPYNIVIEMLERAEIEEEKFVVVEANDEASEIENINSRTYVLPIEGLFNVYLFFRDLIKTEGINHVIFDSLSVLIDNHSNLPVKSMMTNLMLEIGALKCSTSIVVLDNHANHDVVGHLSPLFAKNIYM
ncbi:MAG TPA: hypothetical protein VI564_03870 [Candidatus Nanoarchaeia archaeon]|nr:hypothetical protein [Candidatus Nanoarchaeia archaeon]